MSLRMLRRFTGFILAAILFLFACSLPGRLVQSIRRSGASTSPTPSPSNLTPKASAQQGAASATQVMFSTATPVLAIPTGESAYPGGGTPGGVVPSQSASASPPVGSAVPVGTQTTGSGSVTPATIRTLPTVQAAQGGTPGAYPGMEVGQATLPVDNTYPGAVGVTPSGPENAYPLPGAQATSGNPPTIPAAGQSTATPTASPTVSIAVKQPSITPTASVLASQLSPSPTITKQAGLGAPQPSVTPQKSATVTTTLIAQTQAASSTPVYVLPVTPSSTPIFVIPTGLPTQGGPTLGSPTLGGPILGLTMSPTPTATFFVATETPTPTRTPFLTPTPTITFTPTPTRTPLPVPPWVSVRLHATDPHTVMLAAGKPQLIEFFAFWSGPSLAMAPIVQGIEKEYTWQVNFIYLDIDDPATDLFKQQLHFRVEPHFFLLDAHGKVLQQWVGYVTVEQFRQALDAALP